jgi:hypothetical protein
MFSSFYWSSSGFVIEKRKFQGASISPPVIESSRVLPLASYKRGPSAHTFSRSLAGSPVLVGGADCGILLPRHTFIRGLPLCQRRSSIWDVGSRTIASLGMGFESPFLSPTVAPCPAPRLMVVGHSRGHIVPAEAKLIDPVELHTKYVRVGAALHRGGRGGASLFWCRVMHIKPGFVAFCLP